MPSLIMRLEPLNGAAAGDSHAVSPNGLVSEDARNTPLGRWSSAVAAAHDACLVLDPHGSIVSVSAPAVELLGCSGVGVIGRPLLDVIDVVDLESGTSDPDYAGRIPPLVALDGGGLSRSLMRVRHHDESRVSLDASSAPLHDAAGKTVGSVSFFARVDPA